MTNGPFANWQTPLNVIPITNLLMGVPIEPANFAKNLTCLTRDLNTYVAQTYTNYDFLYQALEAENMTSFATQINGILGGDQLGLHSGAHFIMGAPASSLYVSPQDPIWYPLHTMLDNLFTSWQLRHPDIANTFSTMDGTMTAVNTPPSANVTLDTVQPDVNYFSTDAGLDGILVGDVMSTTAGPFCYKYDVAL